MLEIYLLGRFRVKVDGVPIDEKCWTRQSAKSLVKLLALKPFHALHREQIMDLLWAEQSLENALNNLNKAIYRARRALEPNLAKGTHSQFIQTHKKQIVLTSPGSLSVDLDEFEKLANYAVQNNDFEAGQKAVKLYQGDLLVEDVYDDWIYTRREPMRILFRKTATKTAEIYAAQGDQTASVEILKKLVADDAADEYVQRLLMRLYAETGSKYQALKQFENCRAALHALGIEPEPETIELEQSIKRGEILPSENKFKSASAESSAPNIGLTPRITPLTFQNGVIKSAKLFPDGKSIVVSAAWEGGVWELYTISLETNEMRRLGIKEAEVFSVSAAGEIAVGLKPDAWNGFNNPTTLAILPSGSESPLKLLKNIQWADWHPSRNARSQTSDGRFLAVVRDREGRNCLEYPIGNIIFETGGWISHPRFSADGKKIAFIEHPISNDDEGFIVLLDLEDENRKEQILTDNWLTIFGLAWMKDEIRFTASQENKTRTIYAVNLKGEVRLIYREIGKFKLHDFSKSGKALVTDDKRRNHTTAYYAGDRIERDLSWHDYTIPIDITDDGKTLLINELGGTFENNYISYVRKIDGSATKMIGSGEPSAFSPDGKYALVRIPNPHNHLALINIQTGEVTRLKTDPEHSLIYQQYSCFFPDGKRIVFAANKLTCGTQIYIQNIRGGSPVCFTPGEEGVKMDCQNSISPDGRYAVLKNSENKLSLYRIADGSSSPLKNVEKDFFLIRWCGDGKNLFIWRFGKLPAVIYKYNLASGTMEHWLELMPKDVTGVKQIVSLLLTPDGKSYAYSFKRELSDLYFLEDF